MKISSVLE